MTALKAARVDHERCQELEGRTWFLIPADWTEDQFYAAVEATKADYQNAVDAAMSEAGPRPARLETFLDRIPADWNNLTIGEAKAKAAEHRAAEQDWSNRRRVVDGGFAAYGEPHGLIPLYEAYGDDELGVFERTLFWGHQHGTPLHLDDGENLDHRPFRTPPEVDE